jgi:hypothetical protein
MKQKITILIDREIARLAKEKAAKEHRTLSHIVEEALVTRFRQETATPHARKMAYELFCQRPMKVPPDQLSYVFREDI